MEGPGGGATYALGHSGRELDRLSTQARAFEPFTRRMLQEAGIAPGMRVLDVGSGAGDVAFLCASIVGPGGQVIGMDRSHAAVETASDRSREAGFDNVTFEPGDPSVMAFDEPFDAIVGRLVLMHQPDPAEMLRRLAQLLRPNGIVAFQEFDVSGSRSVPPSPTFDKCVQWITAALNHAGTDSELGPRLFQTFVAAGLPGPKMSLEAAIWGGDQNPGAVLVSETVRTLLPVILKLGAATAEEVEIDTLRDRVQREILAGGGVAISPLLVGAWTRLS